jgi:hypothetical protein
MTIFVLAGSYQQFRYWRQKNREHLVGQTIEPIASHESLMGLRAREGDRAIEVGTFYGRADAQMIRDELQSRGFNIERDLT